MNGLPEYHTTTLRKGLLVRDSYKSLNPRKQGQGENHRQKFRRSKGQGYNLEEFRVSGSTGRGVYQQVLVLPLMACAYVCVHVCLSHFFASQVTSLNAILKLKEKLES